MITADWDKVQSFTVLATDDNDVENLYRAGITLTDSSNLVSSAYNSVADADVSIDVVDNDSGAVVVTQSGGSTLVSDVQPAMSYTLVPEPSANRTGNG